MTSSSMSTMEICLSWTRMTCGESRQHLSRQLRDGAMCPAYGWHWPPVHTSANQTAVFPYAVQLSIAVSVRSDWLFCNWRSINSAFVSIIRIFGSLNLTTVRLKGVGESFKKHSDYESKGIKAHFNMDESGVLSLDRVSTACDVCQPVCFPSSVPVYGSEGPCLKLILCLLLQGGICVWDLGGRQAGGGVNTDK